MVALGFVMTSHMHAIEISADLIFLCSTHL